MKVLFFHAVAGHARVAPALMGQAGNTLRPFQRYLAQAMRTAQQRQVRYKLPWKPVQSRRMLELTALDTRLVVRRPRPGWLVEGWPAGQTPDGDQPLMVVSRGLTVAVASWVHTPRGLRVEPAEPLEADDRVFWCGVPCDLVAEDAHGPPRAAHDQGGRAFPVREAAEHDDEHWLLVVEGRPDAGALIIDGQAVDARACPPFDGLRRLRDGDDARRSWPVARGQIEVDELPATATLRGDDGVRYRWHEQRDRAGRKGCWIQLLAAADAGTDEHMDPRAAFCEDVVEEVWTAPRKHEGQVIGVRRVDRDQYQLLVDALPPPDTLLHLPVDVRNLQLQQRALRQLAEAPLPHHQGLLRLCEDPAHVRWPRVRPRQPDRWRVLTDASRDGTEEQRAFVARALGAADLTLLEGPPGAGKTTAICELVLQLVAAGQRVLLCASTHFAIDNVLERLRVHGEALDAVRIGRIESVDERVQEAHLDRRVERLVEAWRARPALAQHGNRALEDMAKRTVIMAADFTCGTTMGIVRHPLFQDMRGRERPIATMPHWDVLIVDEASKTTIQELMVPALMARRWVIVGDVRQLPPFTDRADITANLRALVDARGREVFAADHQRARLLCWHLGRRALQQPGLRWLVSEPPGVLDHLEKELDAEALDAGAGITAVRVVARGRAGATARVTGPVTARVTIDELRRGDARALHLAAATWVLVPDDLLADVSPLLPADLLAARDLAGGALAEDAAWHFRHQAWLARARPLARAVRTRDRRQCSKHAALETHEAAWLAQNDWAGEVTWRITRIHELRRSRRQDQRKRYQEEVDALLPRTADIARAIDEIRDIGLPSILEVIQEGIGEVRAERASALTEGLGARQREAFEQRFASLSFQHRMHPDISAFPRDLFYGGNALQDANTIADREPGLGWDFAVAGPGGRLPERRVWMDVRGQEAGGVNAREVACMEAVLQDFLRWAAQHGRPQRWEVACLSFYAKQEGAIRDMLRRLTKGNGQTRFSTPDVDIACGTVDRFQGREADLVLLSLRNTRRVGFLDSVNRLNVALTRARHQLVIVGDAAYFERCCIHELEALVKQTRLVPAPRDAQRRPGARSRRRDP